MKVLRTRSELRAELEPARRAGRSIGLVPTMGALHEGHLALLGAARERCELVVMSLFVNPAQFRPGEDFDAYPRDEARDAELAEAAGVEIVYAPGVEAVYPSGFSTFVEVTGELTEVLDGDPRHRGSEHFRGVATVVAKLFNAVQPDLAFFGAKDAQQVALVRRLVADLDIPAEVVALPTVREPDGLALSSRNVHLDAGERERAGALSRGLRQAAASGERDAAALEAIVRSALAQAHVEPEYVALVSPDDFTPLAAVNGRPALLAVAARVGAIRLIDNTTLPTPQEA